MPEEEKVTESRPVEPVIVTMIGTGDGSRLPSGTVAETPGLHMPNVIMNVVPPVVAVAVRFAYLFFFTLSGFLTVRMAPSTDSMVIQAIQQADFYSLVIAGASVAMASSVNGAIKDITAILKGWAAKYPLATGSV